MPRRRTAAEVFERAHGALRRAARSGPTGGSPVLSEAEGPACVFGLGIGCGRRLAILPILWAVLFISSPARAEDLSDRTAPAVSTVVLPPVNLPEVTTQAPSLSEPAVDDAEIDPADPELTADELSAIDEEETAAAFAAAAPTEAESSTALIAAPAVPAAAADDDELWFVSSRCARCETDGTVRLQYWRYIDGKWESRKLADLQAADPSLRTCIHVHGNRVNFCQANAGGWKFYETLTGGQTERPPMRFIIFTWPSDRIQGSSRKDVQAKAVRAECHSYYVAWLARQISPETPLSMVGYSFGTRVIGGALHLLGGGSLRGRAVGEADERPGIRVVMLAAAMDNSHFLPGQAFQCAACQIDQLLVTRNTADRAMKWYPLLYKMMLRPQRGQQALGYTGVAGLHCLPCLAGRVEHRDVTCAVGNFHDWSGCAYLMPGLSERMRQYIYHEPVGSAARSSYAITITASAAAALAMAR